MRKTTIFGCLAAGLLLWAQTVKAQGCNPGNEPTLGVTYVSPLKPSEAAAQGVMTTTLSLTAVAPGSITSHEISTTPNTNAWLGWTVNNATSATSINIYLSVNGGSLQPYLSNVAASGQYEIALFNLGWRYTWVIYASNNGTATPSNPLATQDHVVWSVVSGPNSTLVSQDRIGNNIIYKFTTTFSGTPQISSIDCPEMIQAHHTPTAALQLSNTSGEVHAQVTAVGQVVPANSSVYSSVSDYMSATVGDQITASFGGWMFCDMLNGNIWQKLLSFRVEYAKVIVKDLGNPPRPGPERPVPSVIYDVAPICDNNSDPSDWQPTVVHSWSGRHQYWWGATSLFRWPDLAGVTWIPIASYLNDFGFFDTNPSGPLELAEIVVVGGAIPYPGGSAPAFPIPGKCTRFVGFDSHTGAPYYNVLLTWGSENIPWWPNISGN